MSSNLIPIKSFLGKYYSEILYCTTQDKYKDSGLEKFLEQRYIIQNNKTQMVVDPTIPGLVMIVNGNEIYISKDLYDHPNVVVSNSLENKETQTTNPRSLYNPDVFQTLAYLVCQNHTTLHIIGEIEEPIYIKYKTEYETFYNSVVTFEINDEVDGEIVEEIESYSALNSVTNYVLNAFSKLKLTSFYQNNVASVSYVYRNIFARERSTYNHVLLGKGSSQIIDENKIRCASGSTTELLGVINSSGKNFHSIFYIEPAAQDYKISANYKNILYGNENVKVLPFILGHRVNNRDMFDISDIKFDEVSSSKSVSEINNHVSPILSRVTLERMLGVKRFYDNKSKFLQLP